MRQFVYETEDDENAEGVIKKLHEEVYDSKIVYRKQKPLRVLNNLPKVRVVNSNLKKTAVADIIEYVFLSKKLFSRKICFLNLD